MTVSDERTALCMCAETIEEDDGTDKIDVRDVACIGERRDKKTVLIYDICDLLRKLRRPHESSMAE